MALFKRTFRLFLLLSGIAIARGQRAITLGNWRIRRDTITLSGFSSGGTFAQQLQISHSSLFSGIAVFSHTYYRCGPGNGIQNDYDDVCTTLGNRTTTSEIYDPSLATEDIQRYYKDGLIDNPKYLRDKRLYVFTGLRNFLFTPEMSLNILKIYEPLIQNPFHIRTRVMDAGLVMPTDSYGRNCTTDASESHFIANCGISGAWESFRFLLGPGIRRFGTRDARPKCLQTFSQTDFFTPNERNDMDEEGFVYVPRACKNSIWNNQCECHLHFYFHGCFVSRQFSGMNHILNSGLLEVAEANNIIVVFPQNVNSTENTIGCWDTYGFTGPNYATKKGAQVRVVRKMLTKILGEVENNFSINN